MFRSNNFCAYQFATPLCPFVTHHSQIVVNVLETFATYSGASAACSILSWPLGCCAHWIPAIPAPDELVNLLPTTETSFLAAQEKETLQVAMFNSNLRKLCPTKLTSTKKVVSTHLLGNVGKGVLCWIYIHLGKFMWNLSFHLFLSKGNHLPTNP